MGLLTLLALGAVGVYVWLSGDDDDVEVTPGQLDAISYTGDVEGVGQVRVFRAEMLTAIWNILARSTLEPVPADEAVLPGGVVVYRVRTHSGAVDQTTSALTMVETIRDEGGYVLGTALVPYPVDGGRFLAIGMDRVGTLTNANPATGWSVIAPIPRVLT